MQKEDQDEATERPMGSVKYGDGQSLTRVCIAAADAEGIMTLDGQWGQLMRQTTLAVRIVMTD